MLSTKVKISESGNLLRYIVLAFLVLPTVVIAEGLVFTPYMGYRVGGDFNDISTGVELKLTENQSYGFIIGKDSDSAVSYEFIYGVQPTQLKANGAVTPGVSGDIDVENFLISGKKTLNKESGTFISGLVGATRFDPDSASLDSETRFALGIGGGVDYRINKRIGFRIEARGIATFFNSNGAAFCGSNGGCLVYTESDVLMQYEIISGLTFRF